MLLLELITATALAMLTHEVGHLIVARATGVKCTELSLGLGPKLVSVQIHGLRLSIRVVPLGSFVRLDGTALKNNPVRYQLYLHLAGVAANLLVGFLAFGTMFGWINLLVGAGNVLPLYQHDGWKCGVVLLRKLTRRESRPAEWAFTFSGGFVSLAIGWVVMRMFV